jgi:hypothetical protein
LGYKDINQKLSGEKAALFRKIVGTQEGERLYPKEKYLQKSADGKPVFKRSELIEKYEIKAFFSRTKGEM